MRIARHAKELHADGREVCIAIGMFDGVHLGHQKVFRQTFDDARKINGLAVAVTFDKHPAAIVAPERAPRLIYPLQQKIKVIESLGLDAVWVIEFTEEFSKQPAELFVQRLLTEFGNVHSICVGANFHFGYKRSGNVAVLRDLGARHGFQVHGLSAVTQDSLVISSTHIRETIMAGALEEVARLLGRPYSISGEVVRGDQLGRKLGYPTANVDVTGLVLPPYGVYAVKVLIDGRVYPGVANLGVRPTVNSENNLPRFEVHILRTEIELYGKVIEVEFVQKLRGEMKFAHLEELKSQIKKDAAEAVDLLNF